ncbi:type IV secretion system DNA-binding domain-containing protein [Acetobacter fabarum]|uniref:type IV secretion system DNA-binding domain-containing protein n=1 Tax=Acetobacter fabarum TaxID=483199 RepID=UPI001F54BDEE|nr:type IV secretion system DNA-binding domain-containing protein [Acetobacter fabarum]
MTKDKRQRKAAAELADRYISGTQLVSAQTLAKATTNPDDPAALFIGSVPIPRGFETRHFEMDGSTGSGKTTAMRQMLDGIEARGEPAIVYDISGSFVAQYYNPVRGDIILSPFDARGVYWNLFDEIQHPADAARLARYLINETGDRDRDVWLETARILVANILRQLWEEQRGTPTALIEALQYMTSEELGRWLAHTSSARTFAQDAERATASVLFMLAKAVNLLMFLRADPEPGATSFSFTAFFGGLDKHKGGTRAPWVFVPRKEDYFEAVKPLMALWLECAASATLALPPSNTRRLWFVLDEFPDLPRVDNMTRLLPHWRSLEPRALYQLQKQLGALYRQELAHEVTKLGYELTKGKDSSFEIAALSPGSLEAFSQRAQAIEAQLAERGKSRAQASAAEKQTIALDTRQTKEAVPQAELVQAWREAADSAGLTEEKRRQLVAEAQGRLAAQADQESSNTFGRELLADQAVAQGAAMLGERNSVFATTALHEAAGRFALGSISQAEIAEAITRAETAGGLERRTYLDYRGAAFDGMTTAANIANEMTLLRLEEDGRHKAAPILSPLEAGKTVAQAEQRSVLKAHAWNEEQRTATAQILTSRNQIVGLQGYAGTAKTSTVLATVAKSAELQGYRVTALAPTASAAQVLGDALDSRADTLARHLLASGRPTSQPQLWIVDEASLVSAKDMAKLLSTAQSHRARVLLVGDIKQLGSIEAGAAFEQLQEAGMETAKLTTILRQTNEHTKAAVEASLEGNAKKALEALDRGGGRVVEIASREARFAQIAADYAALSPEERQKTLVIEPSREGRDALTKGIRNKLIESGQLGAEARVFANAESSATHLLEQKSFYVALSRAKAESVLYTDDRFEMQVGLQERVGIGTLAVNKLEAKIQGGKVRHSDKVQKISLAM